MSDRALPVDLERALLADDYFSERGAARVELLHSSARPFSTVHRVRVQMEAGARCFWIKLHTDRSFGSCEHEHRYLRGAADLFEREPGLSIVKSVAYLEALGALVTEDAPGTPLSSLVKRHLNRVSGLLGDRKEEIRRHCYRCGEWLAVLHSRTLPRSQLYERERLARYVDERLERLVEASELDAPFRTRVSTSLERILARVEDEDLVRVMTHGDYAPYNVMVTADALTGLDPDIGGDFRRLDNFCPRYDDLAHFHGFVLGMSGSIVSLRTRRILASLFLEGYRARSGVEIDETSAAFQAFVLKYRLLETLEAAAASRLRRLPWRRRPVRAFRRWFERVWRPGA